MFRPSRCAGWLFALAFLLTASASLAADLVKTEEDWVIDISEPDPATVSPQIVVVLAPEDPEFGRHALFEINHWTLAQFAEGGLQLQVWNGDSELDYRAHQDFDKLATANEAIQFTTRVAVENGAMKFEIVDGMSTTYGTFGGDGYLTLSLPTTATNLNSFNANHSIVHSQVTFGANRITRFARTELRKYYSDGTVVTDDTVQTIESRP